jgi:putative membrane protein
LILPLRPSIIACIWEQGGGYFGVPITNYLGWFFTVYVFFQGIALFLRFCKPGHEQTRSLPKSCEAQAIVMYAVIGLAVVLSYLVDRCIFWYKSAPLCLDERAR